MYDEITPALVIKTALKFRLCPHELSLDVSLLCDAIIGDYNHAFNPRVKLERYFNGPEMHHALLIDEAHNLVDRSRDMFTSALTFSSLAACRKALMGMDAKWTDIWLIILILPILLKRQPRGEDGLSLSRRRFSQGHHSVSGIPRARRFRACCIRFFGNSVTFCAPS
jgi:Rad3-related DNA helicase